jgi:hypothetical protein
MVSEEYFLFYLRRVNHPARGEFTHLIGLSNIKAFPVCI